MAMKRNIAVAMVSKLSEIADLKYIAFGIVRLGAGDFQIDEFPAVQIYNTEESRVHLHRCIQVDWGLNLEIIMRTTTSGEINLFDLLDLEDVIEQKLWSDPKLGLTSDFVHLLHNGSYTVLPLENDIYIQTIRLTARYLKRLVGT